VLFGFACLFLILAVALEKLHPFLIWPLLVLVGWTNMIVHTCIISPNDLRILIGHEPKIVVVRGTLTETPHLKIVERDGEPTEHSLAQVRVSELGPR
jgi:hypothetical protein